MKRHYKHLSRRNFLGKVGAATAAFTIIPRHVMAGTGYLQPSDTVNVAVIGVGAQGTSDARSLCPPDEPIVRPERHGRTGLSPDHPLYKEAIQRDALRGMSIAPELVPPEEPSGPPVQFDPSAGVGGAPMGRREQTAKLANIYALCDVDTEFAGPTFKAYPKAKVYIDYRELLEKEVSNIDAVVIATPDHTHAPIAAAFIKEKKHIYMQKPLAKTPYECRKLAELTEKYDVITQHGNQGHATDNTRRCVEWIQSGVIGFVREVHVQGGGPPWPRGYIQRPEGWGNPPSHLDYDLYTGPAPLKPYHPLCLHNQWRGLQDYGTGYLGDWIGHHFDAIWWALNLDRPVRVHASSTRFSRDYFPEAEQIVYEFAARGYNPPVKLYWRDGGIATPRPIEMEQGRRMPSTIYVGDKGILAAGRDIFPSFIPEKHDFDGPEPWIPRTGNIFEQWIDGIKTNTKTTNDFIRASKIIESGLLGNIAIWMQNSDIILEYDGKNGRFTNSEEANSLLHYEYRKGWDL
jgi:predicted dehydrogenase